VTSDVIGGRRKNKTPAKQATPSIYRIHNMDSVFERQPVRVFLVLLLNLLPLKPHLRLGTQFLILLRFGTLSVFLRCRTRPRAITRADAARRRACENPT